MTPQELAKHQANVMLQWAAGKQIEVRALPHGKWTMINKPQWNWGENEYRVKPREFFLVAHENTVGWQVCEYEPIGQQGTTYIRVREIID